MHTHHHRQSNRDRSLSIVMDEQGCSCLTPSSSSVESLQLACDLIRLLYRRSLTTHFDLGSFFNQTTNWPTYCVTLFSLSPFFIPVLSLSLSLSITQSTGRSLPVAYFIRTILPLLLLFPPLTSTTRTTHTLDSHVDTPSSLAATTIRHISQAL
jgi:predicted Kef-type K+ transport protein